MGIMNEWQKERQKLYTNAINKNNIRYHKTIRKKDNSKETQETENGERTHVIT